MQSNHHHHHPNGIMTAPRPRNFVNQFRHRLGSDGNGGDLSSNGGSGGVHQLMFQKENLTNYPPPHNHHHRASSSYTPIKQKGGHRPVFLSTPERKSRPEHECGLSAMISLETSYRTPSKSTNATTTKKKHRRSPNMDFSESTPAAAATTTKKHKRSTTSSIFMLSSPALAATTKTPMRIVNNTSDEALKRDLFRVIPNTDSKLISSKNYHRHVPQFNPPRKNFFENEDSSSSSSDEDLSGHDMKESSEDIVVIPSANVPTATATTVTATPKQKLRRTIPLPSPNLSALTSARKNFKKQITPPRQHYSSHSVDTNSIPDELGLLRIGFDGLDNYRLTSTELDPSNFQIELPTKKEVIAHAQICNLMNGYTAIQRNFNFAMLSGIARMTLEKEYAKSSVEEPMIAGICHRDVVKQVLDCADDLVVEGFFREYGDKMNGNEKENGGGSGERIEACVFSSESLRQIIVCFRGSTAAQARPVKSNLFWREASSILDEKQKVRILTSFRSAYFSTSLEKTLSFLLANLANRKPFFDVVMTGHSFGAAMATIASLRYAMDNSQMRVLCHAFGSPRIGGEDWRQLVHSVPNLRIYRVEKANDPFVTMPNGNEWVHCGHSIQLGDAAQQGDTLELTAHRFDRSSASNASLSHTLQKVASEPVRVLTKSVPFPTQGSSNGKEAIQSYVDKLITSGNSWFTEFSGMNGKGVSGMDNEMRTLA